ncbi:MAG: AsnC family transcriptional regulator [Flavobacteriales bacterium]|nr:MAG: AsnC family transcriptional regulator [Flavobacteriales bacterium]
MKTVKIDKTDLQILKILQEDGRITNLQLSNEIGLSPAPTLERVRKLERHNMIQSYHASVNASALGLGIQAFIQVALARQRDDEIIEFSKKVQVIDEVVECHKITGDFDFLLKIIVQDIPAFDVLISQKLAKLKEIRQMQSFVILSTGKKSATVPLNYNGKN